MNSKKNHHNIHINEITNERSTHSDTPNKYRTLSNSNLNHLSKYFTKRYTIPQNIYTIGANKSDSDKNESLERNSHSNDNKLHSKSHDKENMSPNIDRHKNTLNKNKQSMNKKSNMKKIITIKSNLKSSKLRKMNQSYQAYSTQKRSITQSIAPDTQITAFDSEFSPNKFLNIFKSQYHTKAHKNQSSHKKDRNQPVIIQLDLYKHRKSIDDTLVSSANTLAVDSISSNKENCPLLSNHNNIFLQKQKNSGHIKSPAVQEYQTLYCSSTQHYSNSKKATFTVRGKPYCDKCAANFITNGQLAVRINNLQKNQFKSKQQQFLTQQRDRSSALSIFIEKLDVSQPQIQQLQTKLIQQIVPIIQNKYSNYFQSINEWSKEAHQLINKRHSQLIKQVYQCQKSLLESIEGIKGRINQEIENIRFMRTDIIQNIGSIVKPNIVNGQKFVRVFESYQNQLDRIVNNQQQIVETQICIPKICKFHTQLLGEMLNKTIQLNYSNKQKKYLFELTNSTKQFTERTQRLKTDSSAKRAQDSDDSPYRLSFGKQIQFSESKQPAQSPTFKMI